MNDIDKLRTVHKSNETSFEYVQISKLSNLFSAIILFNPIFDLIHYRQNMYDFFFNFSIIVILKVDIILSQKLISSHHNSCPCVDCYPANQHVHPGSRFLHRLSNKGAFLSHTMHHLLCE